MSSLLLDNLADLLDSPLLTSPLARIPQVPPLLAVSGRKLPVLGGYQESADGDHSAGADRPAMTSLPPDRLL
jgi:hypothetical protein